MILGKDIKVGQVVMGVEYPIMKVDSRYHNRCGTKRMRECFGSHPNGINLTKMVPALMTDEREYRECDR